MPVQAFNIGRLGWRGGSSTRRCRHRWLRLDQAGECGSRIDLADAAVTRRRVMSVGWHRGGDMSTYGELRRQLRAHLDTLPAIEAEVRPFLSIEPITAETTTRFH